MANAGYRYFSRRIRARKVKRLLIELGGKPHQANIVKKWMGYVHPEAHIGPESPYMKEMKEALAWFLHKPPIHIWNVLDKTRKMMLLSHYDSRINFDLSLVI